MNKMELNNLIETVYVGWRENTFAPYALGDGPIWRRPLVGLAAGDDPVFVRYKEVIGPFHWTPQEVWAAAHPGESLSGSALTVAVLCFPQAEETVADQASGGDTPAPRWVFARNSWNAVVKPFYASILAALARQGVRAVAVDQLPEFGLEPGGFAARWSHRHAAYAAGLGTFGLSDGFISRAGMAVRFITLILEGNWEADPRVSEDPHGWCLVFRSGSCKVCAARCPAGAITPRGHDKERCRAWLERCHALYRNSPGFDVNVEAGCGLCQAGVPCAKASPVK